MTRHNERRPGIAGDPLVVGIGGSTSEPSGTTLLLRTALDLLSAAGARTVSFTGADLAELPIYAPDRPIDEPTEHYLRIFRECDAVIVATPGYHGGMSGLVKNALDHLEALRSDDRPYLDGRAVGVIVTAAGWQGAGTALASVRSAVHALRGWPTPYAVTVNSAEQSLRGADVPEQVVLPALQILTGQLLEFLSWRAAAAAL
ncbi:MAG TPA: NAD(P)H-dependent oxidoreductase [Jatrophihabitantaceae bacterium]